MVESNSGGDFPFEVRYNREVIMTGTEEHANAKVPSPAIAKHELSNPGTVKKMVADIEAKIQRENLDDRSRRRDSSISV